MSTERPRVVVTGAGVVTTLGDRPATLHRALCSGRRGLFPIADAALMKNGMPRVEVGQLEAFRAGDYLGPVNLRPLDRTSQLAVVASQLALEQAGGLEAMAGDGDVGLVLGTMFGSVHTIASFDRRAVEAGPKYAKPMAFANSVINAAAGQTAIWHGLEGINATVSSADTSGLKAIGVAVDLIASGRASALLAGGVDELCFESLYGFFKAGLLACPKNGSAACSVPFDEHRSGFAAGEAAAILTLERADRARERGAVILAEIRGYGNCFDATRGADPENARAAVAGAVSHALDRAGWGAAEVDCLSASANGSVGADAWEASGVAKVLGEGCDRLPVMAIKSMLGETLGASGALQTIALIESMRAGELPGIKALTQVEKSFPFGAARGESRKLRASRGLVTDVGMTGNACALAVERPREDR